MLSAATYTICKEGSVECMTINTRVIMLCCAAAIPDGARFRRWRLPARNGTLQGHNHHQNPGGRTDGRMHSFPPSLASSRGRETGASPSTHSMQPGCVSFFIQISPAVLITVVLPAASLSHYKFANVILHICGNFCPSLRGRRQEG